QCEFQPIGDFDDTADFDLRQIPCVGESPGAAQNAGVGNIYFACFPRGSAGRIDEASKINVDQVANGELPSCESNVAATRSQRNTCDHKGGVILGKEQCITTGFQRIIIDRNGAPIDARLTIPTRSK